MKKILILIPLFTNLLLAQTESETTYFKDKYGRTASVNGPYKLEVKKTNDSITTYVFSKTKNNQKIWTESYLGGQPYGEWVRYDKRGNIESSRDYSFILKYGEHIPDGAIKYEELGISKLSDSNTEKVQKHIRNKFRYPELAQEENIQGRVTVQFTIDKNGNVENLRILEGVHISLDTECFRIMNSLKKLEPYSKDGKKIMVYYTIPITFRMV